ncbi:MAG: FAD-dependent 5-carboxymethylaminomethyl-2-thiouridine(34) oxidoreductase MnmC [Gammaproteobacteria bacterium]|nr:FAD-dependent 5-carboxymethylaminomethyl-2-thiouridine(34) oxidoreductase MnmC [Gammaproteobacteria bacterium]
MGDSDTRGQAKRSTLWYLSARPTSSSVARTALVIGAGLAGCYIAHELAKTGWKVTLIDEQTTLANGASGHRQALLFPGLFHSSSTLESLMQTGYFYSARQLVTWEQADLAKKTGVLYLREKHKAKRAHAFAESIDAALASELAGIPLLEGGYHFSEAGWVDLPKLCEWLVKRDSISLCLGEKIETIHRVDESWQVGAHEASILVLANGMGATAFSQTQHLAFRPVRGEVSMIPTTPASVALKIPLCGYGQVMPAQDGLHAIGATYEPLAMTETAIAMTDKNLTRLNQFPTPIEWSTTIHHSWAGVRTTTDNYFPCVGSVANAVLFRQQYASLRTDAKRFIPGAAESEPGLYIFSGFGSKGLTTIPLLAHALASEINAGRMRLPRLWLKALSPNRFLYKECVTHG